MRTLKNACVAVFLVVLVAGCGTTQVEMKYDPTLAQSSPMGQPAVAMGDVVDSRNLDPNFLGAIRGGFGNVLKTLETPIPVTEVVKGAFLEGLKARNLLKPSGDRSMNLRIVQFHSSQYVRREAYASIEVSVLDGGKDIFKKLYRSEKVSGSALALDVGVFASVDDLKVVANEALQAVIDQALDDPSLRKALN